MQRRKLYAALLVLTVPSLACGFSDYLNRSKAAEAQMNVQTICQDVSGYLGAEHMVNGEVTTGQLPPAAGRAPATVPCGETAMWSSGPEWDAIGFAPSDPIRYAYEYQPDADGAGFTVAAIGDLDCDQETSRFELHATVTDGVADCSGTVTVTDELE